LRCAPRGQWLAFLHRHSLNTAVEGMAAVVAAGSTVVAAEAVFTAAEARVTPISVVADVLPAVQVERRRVHFQGRELVQIAPTARGRTV
jgi:hypothetical protein